MKKDSGAGALNGAGPFIMPAMTIELIFVLAVVVGIFVLLAATKIPPDAILVAGLTAVLAVPLPTDTG